MEQAERDFKTRIENYSKVYDPLCRKKDEKISFIKLIDVGQSYIVHRVQDHIQSRMVYFLMNIKGLNRKSANQRWPYRGYQIRLYHLVIG